MRAAAETATREVTIRWTGQSNEPRPFASRERGGRYYFIPCSFTNNASFIFAVISCIFRTDRVAEATSVRPVGKWHAVPSIYLGERTVECTSELMSRQNDDARLMGEEEAEEEKERIYYHSPSLQVRLRREPARARQDGVRG